MGSAEEDNNRVKDMDKTKPDATLCGPIAKKVVAKVRRHLGRRVVNIKRVLDGRAMAEGLQKTIATQKDLASLDPAHAAYVYTQNQVSVMSEQLTGLKEMAPFADMISQAEDLYVPSAPPMSPLTTSYFTCWAFFDACAGPAHETIGTTILQFGAAFGMHTELLRLIRLMQDSRMGLYIHRGREGNVTIIEDLLTGALYRAIVPAGYSGRKNELWYVRVLPPPIPGSQEHVVFTTPYVVLHPDYPDWMEYFRRTFAPTAPMDDYERHMKYGPTREYWNDFVFEGYVNHQADAIYLSGLPDIPESRPHSEVSQVNGWKGPGFIIQR
jgi:hypothetical protein